MKALMLAAGTLAALMCGAPAFADDEFCREYTRTIYVGGMQKQGFGTACLQPDGSWQIVAENTYDNRAYPAYQAMPVVSQTTYIVREPRYAYYRHQPRPTVLAFNLGGRNDRWDRHDRHDHGHKGRGHGRHDDRHDGRHH